ncbi:hypothetical protein D3C72_1071130 [compost metagenome]
MPGRDRHRHRAVPDHPDRGAAQLQFAGDPGHRDAAGREPGNHGGIGGDAAGKAVRDHPRRVGDQLAEHARQLQHHHRIQQRPRHRRRGRGRAGGPVPCAAFAADRDDDAAVVPQGQPGRRAGAAAGDQLAGDEPGRPECLRRQPDLAHAGHAAGRGAGAGLRAEALCRARARAPRRAGRARPDAGRTGHGAEPRQRQYPGGHARQRAPDPDHPGQPADDQCGCLPQHHRCQPAQRRAGAAVRRGRGRGQRRDHQDRQLAQQRALDRAGRAAPARRQHRGGGRCDQERPAPPGRADARLGQRGGGQRPLALDPRIDPRRAVHAGADGGAGGDGDLPVPAPRRRHADPHGVAADLADRHGGADEGVRLQPGQRLAAGHHARRGPGGGRCHRDAREHRAPYRGRRGAAEGRAGGFARDGLHHPVDLDLAGGGVHPDLLHAGRDRAAVP